MRLWWSVLSSGGLPRLAILVSDDHMVMEVVAGDYSGLPGRVERWLRATTVALRARADGPWRWGPADMRALHAKIMLDTERATVRLVEMTEPEQTSCNLDLSVAILRRALQSINTAQELNAA